MENIKDFKLPLHLDNENNYMFCVESKTNYYIEQFEKLLKINRLNKFHKKLKESLDYIKKSIIKIKQITDCLLQGRDSKAYDSMGEILAENYDALYTSIDKANAFLGNPIYRDINDTISNKYSNLYLFRGRISNPYESFEAGGMLHIPLNQRGKIGSYRYSIPGVPCLYLASNSYIVWKEMNCPSLNELTISAVKIEQTLLYEKIIDLTLPIDIYFDLLYDETLSIEKNEEIANEIIRNLKVIPLIIACSTVCDEVAQRHFKIEYMFPQLLMRFIADNVVGIAYKSNRIEDCNLWTTNLAIPILSFEKDKKYGKIIDEITITDSLNIGYFNDLILPNKIEISGYEQNNNDTCIYNPFKAFGQNSTFNKMIGDWDEPHYENIVPYKNSVFYYFDEYILYFNKLKEIKNEK